MPQVLAISERYGAHRDLFEVLVEAARGNKDQDLAVGFSYVAEGMGGTAGSVSGFAGRNLVPRPVGEDFEFAFENEEGFVFVGMGVGRGSAAGRRGLEEGAGLAARPLAGDKDIDGFAKDFEALDRFHREVQSIGFGIRKTLTCRDWARLGVKAECLLKLSL